MLDSSHDALLQLRQSLALRSHFLLGPELLFHPEENFGLNFAHKLLLVYLADCVDLFEELQLGIQYLLEFHRGQRLGLPLFLLWRFDVRLLTVISLLTSQASLHSHACYIPWLEFVSDLLSYNLIG